jgi:hypothetical protein
MTAANLLEAQTAANTALCAVSSDPVAYRSLSDQELLTFASASAQAQRLAATRTAIAAGEMARRSAPELGNEGMAKRLGLINTVELVKKTTGSTGRDAVVAVRAGRMAHDAADDGRIDLITGEVFEAAEPWMSAAAHAVTAGTLSTQAAEAIRVSIGTPTETVTAAQLAGLVERLLEIAATTDADKLQQYGRRLRDSIDEAGIAERERARYEARAFTFRMRPDGSAWSKTEYDIEGAAIAKDLYDRSTSPKRGGVRFVDPDRQAQADQILNDPRTVEQLAYDVHLGLLKAGANADSSQLLGTGAPQIRVIMTQKTPNATPTVADDGTIIPTPAPTSHGYIDGQPDPISGATIDRLICDGEIIPVIFDETGQAVDVARTQRLFDKKQRLILAVTQGGCMHNSCDRPASWTEAHHIIWISRGGETVLVNGILLCRYHHQLLHNNGWEIRQTGPDPTTGIGEELWLIPPPDIDPEQTPRRMKSRSPAYLEAFPHTA